VDTAIAREIHHADSLAARAVAWAALGGILAAEWARLDYRLHRRNGSREERRPYLDIAWSGEIEDWVRSRLGRPRKALSYPRNGTQDGRRESVQPRHLSRVVLDFRVV
jgi:hypothetical protein